MKRPARRGFTLAEMIVVLAILAITSAAVVPAFIGAFDENPVASTTRDLERVLVAARETALTRAVSVQVAVVPETGRYWVYEEGSAGAVPLDSGSVFLGADVRLWSATRRPTMRFSPIGVAEGDSLTVLGPGGSRALTLARWTGAVSADAR